MTQRMTKGASTVKDLAKASADYNPRTITERELNGLKHSYDTFGDLSGIVLNIRTGTLVSGHQRIKTLKGKKSRIEKHPHTDSYGTVATGWVEYKSANADHISKIPYREVDWSDGKMEKAANIAANAHGGQFDKDKLGALLEELEDATFDIELTGLDPLTLRSLRTAKSEGDSVDREEKHESFKEYDENSFELDNCCPRCKYKW